MGWKQDFKPSKKQEEDVKHLVDEVIRGISDGLYTNSRFETKMNEILPQLNDHHKSCEQIFKELAGKQNFEAFYWPDGPYIIKTTKEEPKTM